MTKFYLIRHGDKDSPADLMVGRQPGVHLTPKGKIQARNLAQFLKRTPISRLFCSPLERAVETAEPLAAEHGLKVESSLAFHELHMGKWTGKTMRQLAAVRSWREFCRYHGGTPIPGGETLAEAQARVVSEMMRLRQRHPNGGVAIVTHEDPIRLAVCYFIGAPIDVYEQITVRLGSVTTLSIDAQHAVLERLDEVPGGRLRRG